jgi:ribosomal protein S18 acetylase RimI-like enzyme
MGQNSTMKTKHMKTNQPAPKKEDLKVSHQSMEQNTSQDGHKIVPLDEVTPQALKDFSDLYIGKNYFSESQLADFIMKSQKNGIQCSLALVSQNQDSKVPSQSEVLGMRLTFPPQNWDSSTKKGLSVRDWPHPLNETAYFQSLFLAPQLRGQGWGGRLSEESIHKLLQLGVSGVVCHSWLESPQNSSLKYLLKMGFKKIKTHPQYWSSLDYECVRCGKPPCLCTAEEMYLDLRNL